MCLVIRAFYSIEASIGGEKKKTSKFDMRLLFSTSLMFKKLHVLEREEILFEK